MSCVLRAYGAEFDVDAFLRSSGLSPLIVYRRGEPRSSTGRPQRVEERSGINLSASAREFSDLRGQIEDAVQFLTDNGSEIRRLRRFPGVEGLVLDFPVEDRNAFVVTNEFPAKLLLLLGNLDIDLALSTYPAQEEQGA
jgi:hypothetical protein